MSRQNLEKVEIPSIDQVKNELAEIENRRKYIRALRSTVYVLIVVAAVAVLISTLVFPVLQVSGTSMEPTLTYRNIEGQKRTPLLRIFQIIFGQKNKANRPNADEPQIVL